jgi:hypothetical protein
VWLWSGWRSGLFGRCGRYRGGFFNRSGRCGNSGLDRCLDGRHLERSCLDRRYLKLERRCLSIDRRCLGGHGSVLQERKLWGVGCFLEPACATDQRGARGAAARGGLVACGIGGFRTVPRDFLFVCHDWVLRVGL